MENTNTDATKKEYTILYPDVYDELQDCGGKMTYEQAVEKAKATSKNTGYVYLYADEDLDKPDGGLQTRQIRRKRIAGGLTATQKRPA